LISWHAYAGLALALLLVIHLLPNRWRLLRPREPATTAAVPTPSTGISRRTALQTGAIGVAGLGLWSLAQVSGRIAGSARRFTGSQAIAVAVPPSTTFFGEPTPALDRDAWRLRIFGRVDQPMELSAADLAAWPATTMRA